MFSLSFGTFVAKAFTEKTNVKENAISRDKIFFIINSFFKQQGQPFADCPAFYSTVTDFARFLGLSTSLPLRTEV